jgi:IS30 family transposase
MRYWPASLWECGTNENTKGLIRRYFLRGTDFNVVSAREIRRC